MGSGWCAREGLGDERRSLTTASRLAVTSKELIALLRLPWLIPRR